MEALLITNAGGGAEASLPANQSQFNIKVTSFDGSGLSGRKITFTPAAGAATEANTDDHGKLSVVLSPGTYTISVDTPSNYEKPANQTITAEGGTAYDVEFHMYSNVNPVTVRLYSFDDAGISGCTLTVKKKGTSTVVGTHTFSNTGILNFNLASGSYDFVISGNSSRYVTPAAQSKTLSRGGSATIDFTLATNVGTVNVTVTSFNNAGISGTKLTIKNGSATVGTKTFPSNSDNTYSIDLNPGTYTVSLSGIQQGYDAVEDKTVTVVRGGTHNVAMFIPERSVFTYGVRIQKSNSTPGHLVYTDDAAGLNPSTMSTSGVFTDNGWTARLRELFGMRPCVVKNGVVQYYLQDDNFTKKADGGTAVLTGADGDVMMEFTRGGYISITSDSSYIYVKISNTKVDNTFQQLAFSYKGVTKDKFYIGVYKGSLDGSNLRSISGKAPANNKSITQFITHAHNTGGSGNAKGYEIVNFYKLTFLQVLYLIRFKNLDSQTAVGKGYTGGSVAQTTGVTNSNPLCYGTNSATGRVKVNGIEDFWGNIWEWIDGIFCDSSRNVRTGDTDIVSAGNGANYTSRVTLSANIGGWINDVHATNELGFLIKSSSGSETTYYCDYGSCYAGCVGYFGGYWGNGAGAGAFLLSVSNSLSNAYSYIGARLAVCGA